MITEGLARWAALAVGAMISVGSHAQVKTDAPAPAAATAAPAPASTVKPAAAPGKTDDTTRAKAPARGGGLAQVWVDAGSKVYQCPGTKGYGATTNGEYMTEADAKASGKHPDHNKTCS
jgi:hypothetical protein